MAGLRHSLLVILVVCVTAVSGSGVAMAQDALADSEARSDRSPRLVARVAKQVDSKPLRNAPRRRCQTRRPQTLVCRQDRSGELRATPNAAHCPSPRRPVNCGTYGSGGPGLIGGSFSSEAM